MKLFVTDFHRNAEIYIYGIDDEEHTEDFLVRFFSDKGLIKLSKAEKKDYGTAADYAMDNTNFAALVQIIEKYQAAIDRIADDIEQTGCDPYREYSFDNSCYVI